MATSSFSKQPASVSNVAVGAYLDAASPSAFTLTIGFKPRYVKIVNETSKHVEEWFEGMADAEAFQSTSTGQKAMITSSGITPTTRGFTVGLDALINLENEQLSWLALG